MKARYIQEIGTQAHFRIFWDAHVVLSVASYDGNPSYHRRSDLSCPNSLGSGRPGYHDARRLLGQSDKVEDWYAFGIPEAYEHDIRWPTTCDHCGAPVPTRVSATRVGDRGIEVTRQIFTSRRYDTPSGSPEPGDLYYHEVHDPGECPYWDNCDGKHLCALVPTGEYWDIDSRASNCTMKEDRTHRCWIRHGEYPMLTVDKNGHTCAAGAGSIQTTHWHGFLRNGEFA